MKIFVLYILFCFSESILSLVFMKIIFEKIFNVYIISFIIFNFKLLISKDKKYKKNSSTIAFQLLSINVCMHLDIDIFKRKPMIRKRELQCVQRILER